MFYKEEDIQPVVNVVEQTLGPQGNMMFGKTISKNVIIGSSLFGKLWYGDVDGDMEYVDSLCHVLSQRIGQKIFVVSDLF
jgi:hypothetical protein